MNFREWALVIFGVLNELAVGSFVVLGIVHFYAQRKAGTEEADRISDRALLAIGPVLVLGVIASLGHLGNPLNAPRAVTNLGTSWLSREIFFSMAFVVLGAVFAFMQWRKISTFAVRNVVAWIAALIGLAGIYSMSRIYLLESQPAWNTVATPVLFFAATFLLGALAIGSALALNLAYLRHKAPGCVEVQCNLLRQITRGIAIAGLVLLGIELITIPLQTSYLTATGVPAALASIAMTYQNFSLLLVLRLALVFIGAGIFTLFLYQSALIGKEQLMSGLVYTAFALVLVSEVLARYLFYATHVKIGL